jgi:hypothetical protein
MDTILYQHRPYIRVFPRVREEDCIKECSGNLDSLVCDVCDQKSKPSLHSILLQPLKKKFLSLSLSLEPTNILPLIQITPIKSV